jgi:hypothetical protein
MKQPIGSIILQLSTQSSLQWFKFDSNLKENRAPPFGLPEKTEMLSGRKTEKIAVGFEPWTTMKHLLKFLHRSFWLASKLHKS